ncbi:hypothetical protein [Rhodoplanes serenus]|jgi:uncharacterized coiled-coil protein SlyX|uniref:hypothetical protein n=1 Tax=Rhodoplanes serenus TaxID=200615 RepID=UPI000DAD05B8|nr:hypothetical protein [Rhodoplanes serenus]MBI5112171.1 hypothetical protein [Rhodovulum sp.]RAI33611.1 hypothetical protein CH340_11675 [Rhodoplanes serenus]
MAEPENMTLVLLRELRSRMETRFDSLDRKLAEHDARFDAHDARFTALEKKIDTIKQAAFAESILGRYAVVDVEQRLTELEERLAALEKRA